MLIVPRETDLTPTAYGLFTIGQVSVLADKRGLLTESIDDYGCQVRHGAAGEPSHLMAHRPKLWHPVAIFTSCRKALGTRKSKSSFEVDATAKITNPAALNEKLIAQIIGADGVKPYASRRRVGVDRHVVAGDRTTELDALFNPKRPANIGMAYYYRRALRALADAGMIDLKFGAKGGLGTATFEWTELAKLQPDKPDPVEEPLTDEDRDAINSIASS